MSRSTRPHGLRGPRMLLWPLLIVRDIWVSAVVDEPAVRFNLRLLAGLTALFGLPDLVQGLLMAAREPSIGGHIYGAYVTALAVVELVGALLLARRSPAGRWLIVVAALGFYLEAALGLAAYDRGVVSAAIFAAAAPAEAWVLWFLTHRRVRAHIATWRNDPGRMTSTAGYRRPASRLER